jgi:hypothetical protein
MGKEIINVGNPCRKHQLVPERPNASLVSPRIVFTANHSYLNPKNKNYSFTNQTLNHEKKQSLFYH